MKPADSPCDECGASGALGKCEALFSTLLALDHERRQPWGRFHGLNFACFALQHPERAGVRDLGPHWRLVRAFVAGGLPAAERLQAEWVRANRRTTRGAPPADAAPPRVAAPSWTIEDLAVDGTFPAPGYAERMRAWADSILREREPQSID